MGKYMIRKCKGIPEVNAVMEVAHVGARTRARALSMAAAASSGTAKRRKVGGGEVKLSSSLIQRRSRRGEVVTPTPENSVSATASGNSGDTTVFDRVTASCCSSNAADESSKTIDLEDDSKKIETSTSDFDFRGRRDETPLGEFQAESSIMEATARPMEGNSQRRSSASNVPSETELEEFFTAAEKHLQKRFTERYNYDIVKDVPLEGCYEWIQLKP